MSNAVDSISNLVRHLEYDMKYKWPTCTQCGEKTPGERFLVGDQICLLCSSRNAMVAAARKAQWMKFWNRRGTNPIEANPELAD